MAGATLPRSSFEKRTRTQDTGRTTQVSATLLISMGVLAGGRSANVAQLKGWL